ncbi:MoaD/ThiS family protein [Stieleria sp. JC731]|uniref:MoaD/ThiS family protein n=1 Tax=Pirellulaceae TaxID=2691357 RepID=UPI001E3ECC37|nr:MoaD/ThiS family protein [Stieleria sp. JC731]MCC9603250.1 MoaD/ThiS family protein [Stieleria sp. JC731]
MKIEILLFAALRDAAGESSIRVDADGIETAGDLISTVADVLPEVAQLIRHSRLAIDGAYVGEQTAIDASASEFALIPPVSGG